MSFIALCNYQGHLDENTLGFCFHENCQQSPEFCFKCLNNQQQFHKEKCFRFEQLLETIKAQHDNLEGIKSKVNEHFHKINVVYGKIRKFFRQDQIILETLFNMINNKNFNEVKQNLNEISKWINSSGRNEKLRIFLDNIESQSQAHCNFLENLFGNLQLLNQQPQESSYVQNSDQVPSQQFVQNNNPQSQQRPIQTNQGSSNYVQASSQLSNNVIQGQDDDDMEQFYSEIADNCYNDAKILFDRLQYDQALKALDDSLAHKETDKAYILKGNALYLIQRYDEALISLQKCIDFNGFQSGPALFGKALILEGKGDYHEALETLQLAEMHPECINPSLYSCFAKTLNGLKRYQESINYSDKSLAISSTHAQAYNNKAISLTYLNRFEEALQQYNFAIQYNPIDPQLHLNKGDVLHKMNKYNEALICLNEALRLHKLYYNPKFNKGLIYKIKIECLQSLERLEEALQCVDECLENCPQEMLVHQTKIKLLIQLNRGNEAQRYGEYILQKYKK